MKNFGKSTLWVSLLSAALQARAAEIHEAGTPYATLEVALKDYGRHWQGLADAIPHPTATDIIDIYYAMDDEMDGDHFGAFLLSQRYRYHMLAIDAGCAISWLTAMRILTGEVD